MIALAMTRSPRRYVAPAALAVIVLAVILVITSNSGGGSQNAGSSGPSAVHSQRVLHHTYRVRAGDSLSIISARTGVSVDTLEQLNPGVDPNALLPGQRIRLRP